MKDNCERCSQVITNFEGVLYSISELARILSVAIRKGQHYRVEFHPQIIPDKIVDSCQTVKLGNAYKITFTILGDGLKFVDPNRCTVVLPSELEEMSKRSGV